MPAARSSAIALRGRAPLALDSARRRAARRDGGRIRGHAGAEDRAEPDPRAADRQGLLADLRLLDTGGGDPVQAAQAGPRAARDRRRRRQRRAHARLGQAPAPRQGRLHLERPRRRRQLRRPGRLQAARPPLRRSTGRSTCRTRCRWTRRRRASSLVSVAPEPLSISPDGDGNADRIGVAYKLSERAHAMLFVDGKRVVFTRGQQPGGRLELEREGGRQARRARARTCSRLAAQDIAGNVGPGRSLRVGIRYVELARAGDRGKGAGRGSASASLPMRRVRWRSARADGTAKPGLLVLRAPGKPRPVHADRRVGPHRAARSSIVGEAMTRRLAHAGGPVAAAGLALVIARDRAATSGWPGSPPGSSGARASRCLSRAVRAHEGLRGAAVVGVVGAVGIAELFHRWPWLIAVSALACAPARIPVHVGSTDSNLLCRCTR